MHLEEFAEGKSILHNLDPRVKIIVFVVFSIFCVLAPGVKLPLFFLFYSLALLFIARPNTKAFISRLAMANLFIGIVWIFIPLSYKGNTYLALGSMNVSQEGIQYAVSITLKSNAVIIGTIALISTSSAFRLAHAMLHLKVPKKLIILFFLFYRYITVVHEEYLTIKRAILLRGFVPRTDIHTYRTFAYMVGGLLIKSYERAEEIYKAMLCRGFGGSFPLLDHFRMGHRDALFLLLSILTFFAFWMKS
ncbi:MAG: cobalt ECF transporter T component CbiQ [Deltaproteobacteria bacterium]|nr:cobalt ECF transporter T component CbiQ [Deltaproteobacteria bacterium]